MANVISFEVKLTGPQANVGQNAFPSDPNSVYWPRPLSGGAGQANSDYPYDYLPFNGEFDTYYQANNWQSQVASAPTAAAPTANTALAYPLKPIRITGIQIRLRSYDPKNQTTRQTTITSAL
jgi:hypothetical protein